MTNSTTPPPGAGRRLSDIQLIELEQRLLAAEEEVSKQLSGHKIAVGAATKLIEFHATEYIRRLLDDLKFYRSAPLAPPREVTEAMVETAIEAYFTFHHEYFVDDTDDHWTSGVYRHGDVTNHRFWGPGEKRDARDWLERAAIQAALNALTAALNAPPTKTLCEATEAIEEFERQFSDSIGLARRILAAVPDDYNPRQLTDIGNRARNWVMKAYRDWCDAALDAPARTASDLNIERQVAGLDDIDRDDAAKWRAVSEECEKAGCCLLDAPARVDENALPTEMLPVGWRFTFLQPFDDVDPQAAFTCEVATISSETGFRDAHGFGPTPRAAFEAACAAARERGDG